MRRALLTLVLFAANSLAAGTNGTYFTYNEEQRDSLSSLSSTSTIKENDLMHWDTILADLQENKPLPLGNQSRLTAYLYVAQREYVALAGDQGSLDPLSLQVVQLFYPNYTKKIAHADELTQATSDLVYSEIQARFQKEEAQLHDSQLKIGCFFWKGKPTYAGREIASFRPWHLARADQERVSKPELASEDFWKPEIIAVKDAAAFATPDKKEKARFWTRKSQGQSANWIEIANQHLFLYPSSLQEKVSLRADLATTLEDSLIAAFDSKYAYCIKRPTMMDQEIESHVQLPNHPSYPSSEVAQGAAASAILSHYLPEQKNVWSRLAENEARSQVWAGIHFPVDTEAGQEIGHEVAMKALKD